MKKLKGLLTTTISGILLKKSFFSAIQKAGKSKTFKFTHYFLKIINHLDSNNIEKLKFPSFFFFHSCLTSSIVQANSFVFHVCFYKLTSLDTVRLLVLYLNRFSSPFEQSLSILIYLFFFSCLNKKNRL